MTNPTGGFMFSPESEIVRPKDQFNEDKAQIWADGTIPLGEKNQHIEQLWREFNQQRQELRSTSQGSLEGSPTGEEYPSPQRSRAPFLPRRRRPSWK
jgi:hypothetical protein